MEESDKRLTEVQKEEVKRGITVVTGDLKKIGEEVTVVGPAKKREKVEKLVEISTGEVKKIEKELTSTNRVGNKVSTEVTTAVDRAKKDEKQEIRDSTAILIKPAVIREEKLEKEVREAITEEKKEQTSVGLSSSISRDVREEVIENSKKAEK